MFISQGKSALHFSIHKRLSVSGAGHERKAASMVSRKCSALSERVDTRNKGYGSGFLGIVGFLGIEL